MQEVLLNETRITISKIKVLKYVTFILILLFYVLYWPYVVYGISLYFLYLFADARKT